MQVIDFFHLERSLQDRFVEAASGAVPPTPLAFQPARLDPRVLIWGAAAVVGAAGFVVVLLLGFGSLSSPLSLQPPAFAAILGLCAAAAVFAALRALSLDNEQSGLPYRAGIYVFPIGVVDARSGVLRELRFGELSNVAQSGRRVTLSFDDARFHLDLPDPALAAQLVQAVEQHRQRVSGDSGPPSSRELAGLDPLADTGFKSPFTPLERRTRRSPKLLRFGWLLALAIGALVGPAAWKGRNALSEERLYAAARGAGTAEQYRAYLQRGGKRSEVTEILLPRAELGDAVAKKSVAALEQYIQRGTHRKIEPEVQAALRSALLAELETTAQKGSLTALLEFERAQKNKALVQAEIDARKLALYQKAARSFSEAAQPSTPGLVGFFGRLLFYAQKHGPEVEIRFRRRATDSAKDAEAQLMKSAYYLGPGSLPSQFFEPADWDAREADVGNEIAARLNREFPSDILRFKLGPVLEDDGQDPPKLDKPALVITHREEMSGAFMSKKPRGVFVALGVMVRAALVIPGDDQPLTYKFTAWLPPDLKRWEQPGTTPESLYDALGRSGLDKFSKKLLSYVLKAP